MTKEKKLDSIVDRMWNVGVGYQATEVFAAGATVLINAAAAMPQSMRTEAAHRLRVIADRIQTGEAFESPPAKEPSP